MTGDLSISKCSHEDYHGGTSASVPFTWESQPGTPRISKFRENPLPPLTPPPSYYSNLASKRPIVVRKNSKNLFQTIFPKRTGRKKQSPSSSPAASSTSSSSSSNSSFNSSPRPTSYSVPSSPMVFPRSRAEKEMQSPIFSFGSKVDDREDEEYDEHELRKSNMMCFGSHSRSSPGLYSFLIKKANIRDYCSLFASKDRGDS